MENLAMHASDYTVPGLLALVAVGFTAAHEYQIWKKRPVVMSLVYGRKAAWLLAGVSFGLAVVLPFLKI